MTHIKIKDENGETVEMCDSIEEAKDRKEKLKSEDENIHIVNF